MPMMYVTDDLFAKVRRNKEEPDARFIKGETEYHIIPGILDLKIDNRKT